MSDSEAEENVNLLCCIFTFLGNLIQLNCQNSTSRNLWFVFLPTVSLGSGQSSLFLPRLLFSIFLFFSANVYLLRQASVR